MEWDNANHEIYVCKFNGLKSLLELTAASFHWLSDTHIGFCASQQYTFHNIQLVLLDVDVEVDMGIGIEVAVLARCCGIVITETNGFRFNIVLRVYIPF